MTHGRKFINPPNDLPLILRLNTKLRRLTSVIGHTNWSRSIAALLVLPENATVDLKLPIALVRAAAALCADNLLKRRPPPVSHQLILATLLFVEAVPPAVSACSQTSRRLGSVRRSISPQPTVCVDAASHRIRKAYDDHRSRAKGRVMPMSPLRSRPELRIWSLEYGHSSDRSQTPVSHDGMLQPQRSPESITWQLDGRLSTNWVSAVFFMAFFQDLQFSATQRKTLVMLGVHVVNF